MHEIYLHPFLKAIQADVATVSESSRSRVRLDFLS
jgi:hypothetical protein